MRPGSESAKASGLLMESVITTDNLATVRYAEIDRVIENIPDLTEIDAALRTSLELLLGPPFRTLPHSRQGPSA